jgi:DNA transformation protein
VGLRDVARNAEFIAFVADQLAPIGHVTVRPMFSGAGIYCDGTIFALVIRDALYLKVDDANRPDFAAAGSSPFTYEAKGRTVEIGSYWRAPEHLFDDPDDMLAWGRVALAAGRRAAVKEKPERKRR